MTALSDVSAGHYPGRKTKLYYNDADGSGTHATPDWVLISRARNVQTNQGRNLGDVEHHGSAWQKAVEGYRMFSGSFEYVKKKGSDSVYDFLKAAADAGDEVELKFLNGPNSDANSKGWRAPVKIGTIDESASGGDPVVVTIEFKLADAYDDTDAEIVPESATGDGP